MNRRGHRSGRRWIRAVWPLLLLAAPAGAATSTADEQAMLAELLGTGVVGEPVAGARHLGAYKVTTPAGPATPR